MTVPGLGARLEWALPVILNGATGVLASFATLAVIIEHGILGSL